MNMLLEVLKSFWMAVQSLPWWFYLIFLIPLSKRIGRIRKRIFGRR